MFETGYISTEIYPVLGKPVERKFKHLELIQAIITRMANNSFLLKGWSVVLVSAIFILASKETKSYFICLAYLPAIMFWILDGYFLWQERLYRKLYDKVRKMKNEDIDFSMDTSSLMNKKNKWIKVVFSKTLIIFHGAIVGAIMLVSIILNCKK